MCTHSAMQHLWPPFLPFSWHYLTDISLMDKAYASDSDRAGTRGLAWCFLEWVTGVRGPLKENVKERKGKGEKLTNF